MTVSSSIMYAVRLLFPKAGKKSTAIRSMKGALLCVGISLIPLVVVMTISNGMVDGITARLIGLSSSHLLVKVPYFSPESESPEALTAFSKRLETFTGITAASPEIQGTALAAGKKGRTGAVVRAVNFSLFDRNQSFRSLLKVTAGTIPQRFEAGRQPAVIGEKIASLLGIGVGDTFRLITGLQGTGGAVVPKMSVFRVAAVVSCGYEELDALWIFIPLTAGMQILPAQSSAVSVMLETPDAFSQKLPEIQTEVEKQLNGEMSVYRWDQLNSSEYENFASTRMMLTFIMLLIVLVASVNISSALVMLAMERRYEIAVLKSLGGTSEGITFSFLITGAAVGLGGVLFGIPLGLLVSVNINKILHFSEKTVNIIAEFVYLLRGTDLSKFSQIHLLDPAYYLQIIPVSIPCKELVLIGICTLILSLAVSAVPAVKAGCEKPIEILRKS
ncbi:MAG: ABC transporter permease [Treponema sp.]|jgi:lipoprotein-releasing system permease protein|nr:ABC transporter permease [Treponema sp.]